MFTGSDIDCVVCAGVECNTGSSSIGIGAVELGVCSVGGGDNIVPLVLELLARCRLSMTMSEALSTLGVDRMVS